MPVDAAAYRRYHIPTRPAPEVVPLPPRFRVRVSKWRLVALVLRDLIEYRAQLGAALSRPCIYGVLARPVGGLAPIEDACVGCLRCTVEYPEIIQIVPNRARERWGGWDLPPDVIETVLYEARTGRVPVRGAGYRGPFGGDDWDGIWLDMSEIVRPTRDGIHGREYIATTVDIGERPPFVRGSGGDGASPDRLRLLTLSVPFLLGVPPADAKGADRALRATMAAAASLDTLAYVPVDRFARSGHASPRTIPLVGPHSDAPLDRLPEPPAMIELDGWDAARFAVLRARFPEAVVAVRVAADADVVELVRQGARVLHLAADGSGRAGGRHLSVLIRRADEALVGAGVRDEVTLLGSGGLWMAEHVAKAIACGLDAVVLDTPLWLALQGRWRRGGEAPRRLAFPAAGPNWSETRLTNLAASWRDQLLEVLGAMGIREVRRLRGETGRMMLQADLEHEAFAGIAGYG